MIITILSVIIRILTTNNLCRFTTLIHKIRLSSCKTDFGVILSSAASVSIESMLAMWIFFQDGWHRL
jgi:hypothetical protein